jgi:hypothetical protein
MGCGCNKQGNGHKTPETTEGHDAKMGLDVNTVVKWVVFIILTVLSPIVAPPIVVWALYKGIIKNEKLDAILMLRAITQAAKTVLDKDEDAEDLDMDELEVVEVPKGV